MNEAQTEETELVPVACGICRVEMLVPLPVDPTAREFTQIALRKFPPAHEECIAQRQNEREAGERRDQSVARMQAWTNLCPPEFLKPLDFTLCNRAMYDRVMKWQFGSRGIIATGRTARCKTRFLFKLCEREFFGGRSVVYVRHPDYREVVSRLAYKDANALWIYTQKFIAADIVFFDDLGKGRITEASEEALESMINNRGSMGRVMFFTTNDGDESLQGRLSADRGEPMIRRIFDHCEPIDFGFK